MAVNEQSWLDAVKNIGIVVSLVASAVSLFLSIRRERRERTILKFNVKRTLVAEGDENDPGEISDSIRVILTNQGSRPITVHHLRVGVFV